VDHRPTCALISRDTEAGQGCSDGLAGFMSAVVASAVLVAITGPAGPAHATEPATECASVADLQQAALDLAVRCQQPVEVLDARTPWETLTALPSGELTWSSTTVATRTRVNGAWEPVDTSLVAGPRGFAPKAAVLPMSFSPGGDHAPLARIEHGGRSLEMSWEGSLPAPEVSDSTLTYRSVLPGVDLVVTVD
jgi:hypothetical protein